MKLVLAIVQDADSDDLIDEITNEGYIVTKVISTGGFLKSGNSTIMIGTDDSEVDRLIELISHNCKVREIIKSIQPMNMPGTSIATLPIKVKVGGATVFVLDVVDFKRF